MTIKRYIMISFHVKKTEKAHINGRSPLGFGFFLLEGFLEILHFDDVAPGG